MTDAAASLPTTMVPVLGEGLVDWWTKLNFRAPGASEVAHRSDMLFFGIYAISAFFFVLLMVLMVWFSFRYRRRPGAAPVRSASHNTLLELSWSVIPTAILVGMFFFGFWGYADHLVAPAQSTELLVTGQKWSWTVAYPNGAASPETTRTGALDIPILVVPENQPVKLRMSSIDVIHAFWIPDFRAKFDVFPNRFTSMWFQPGEIKGDAELPAVGGWKKWAGTKYQDHWVFCAEYCGSNHSEMAAVIRVVPVKVYQEIVAAWASPRGKPIEVGAKLYKIKGCNSCHSVDGSKNVGPSWKDIYGRSVQFSDGTGLSEAQKTGTDFANYIRESVYEPQKRIVAGYPNQMQTYQGKINEQELEAIIAYMKYISAALPAEEKAAMESAPEMGGDQK